MMYNYNENKCKQTEKEKRMIDLREESEIVDAVNAVLNNGHIVELRPERTGIAVVEINRTLKVKQQYTDRPEKKDGR